MSQTEPNPPKRRGRGKSKLRRSALTRGTEALLAAKLPLKRVELNTVTGIATYFVGEPEEGHDLDTWLAKRDAHST